MPGLSCSSQASPSETMEALRQKVTSQALQISQIERERAKLSYSAFETQDDIGTLKPALLSYKEKVTRVLKYLGGPSMEVRAGSPWDWKLFVDRIEERQKNNRRFFQELKEGRDETIAQLETIRQEGARIKIHLQSRSSEKPLLNSDNPSVPVVASTSVRIYNKVEQPLVYASTSQDSDNVTKTKRKRSWPDVRILTAKKAMTKPTSVFSESKSPGTACQLPSSVSAESSIHSSAPAPNLAPAPEERQNSGTPRRFKINIKPKAGVGHQPNLTSSVSGNSTAFI